MLFLHCSLKAKQFFFNNPLEIIFISFDLDWEAELRDSEAAYTWYMHTRKKKRKKNCPKYRSAKFLNFWDKKKQVLLKNSYVRPCAREQSDGVLANVHILAPNFSSISHSKLNEISKKIRGSWLFLPFLISPFLFLQAPQAPPAGHPLPPPTSAPTPFINYHCLRREREVPYSELIICLPCNLWY